MRYCTNCGNPFSGNEKFCTKCGTPAETIRGTAIPPNAKSSNSHKLRNIIIACLFVIVVGGGGALAANYAVNEVFVSSGRELQKMAKAIGEINNLSYDSSAEINIDLIDGDDRENINNSVDIDGELSVDDKTMRSNIKVSSDDDTEALEMYFEYDDDNIDWYGCEVGDDYWEKGRINLDGIIQSSEETEDYSWLTEGVLQTEGIEKTELDGIKAFVIDMGIDVSVLKNNIKQKYADEWSSVIEDYADELGASTDEVLNMFENMQAIDVKLYVDRKTDLPIKVEFDAKNSLSSFMNNMVSLAYTYGADDIGVEVKQSNIVIDFEDYNSINVSIPPEAYNGYDNGIINE